MIHLLLKSNHPHPSIPSPVLIPATNRLRSELRRATTTPVNPQHPPPPSSCSKTNHHHCWVVVSGGGGSRRRRKTEQRETERDREPAVGVSDRRSVLISGGRFLYSTVFAFDRRFYRC
ncbi:hypothetical protein Hanom_Chr16g01457671 [Helianthus anomalus]